MQTETREEYVDFCVFIRNKNWMVTLAKKERKKWIVTRGLKPEIISSREAQVSYRKQEDFYGPRPRQRAIGLVSC